MIIPDTQSEFTACLTRSFQLARGVWLLGIMREDKCRVRASNLEDTGSRAGQIDPSKGGGIETRFPNRGGSSW